MANYLDKLSLGRKGSFTHALSRTAVDAAVFGGASFGYGYLMNRYREKAHIKGVPADLAAGIGFTALSFLGDWYGVGGVVGGLSHATKMVGLAGIGAFCHTLGAGRGSQHSGVARVMVKKGDIPKVKAAVPGSTILGEIPKAPHGDFLSAAQLDRLANAG